VLAELEMIDIDYDDVMQLLEVEGVEKFDASWITVGAELERSLGRAGPEA
jgi:transaldolase